MKNESSATQPGCSPIAFGDVGKMKIIDLSAGNRAIWFDQNYRDAVYVDVRPEVCPDIVADATALPAEVGSDYDLVVFDPPHKNNGANGNMAHNYGHWDAEEIRRVLIGTAREAHRISKPNALMAFKWNDHSRQLHDVLVMLSQWWEPLFGHGARSQQRHATMTYWVMLRRRPADEPFSLHREAIAERPVAGRVTPNPVVSNTQEEGNG